MNLKNKGDQLEKRVEKLFKRLGKWNVKKGTILKDSYGNISQIDVVFGLFRKKYIECKNYSKPVPLEDVAKFKEVVCIPLTTLHQVLRLNGISKRRGIFITTNDYVPRAVTIGIKTINGKQLRQLERFSYVVLFARRSFHLACFGALAVGGYYAFQDPQYFKKQTDLLMKQDFSIYYRKLETFAREQYKKWI